MLSLQDFLSFPRLSHLSPRTLIVDLVPVSSGDVAGYDRDVHFFCILLCENVTVYDID
jgi:hypothetical protein